MREMKIYSVIDFTGALSLAKKTNDVWDITKKFFSQYGLDGLVYLDANGKDFTLRSTLPQSWHKHYIDSDYQEIDPFAKICCSGFTPVATGATNLHLYNNMSSAQNKLVREAGETGFKSGFSSTFRLLSPRGFGGWNLMSSEGKKSSDAVHKEYGDMLHLAALCAHQALPRTSTQVDISPLSPREAECLQWLASGLRTKQIAHKMGLKPITIEFHFKNAREKLLSSTRDQALAKAISLGYITL